MHLIDIGFTFRNCSIFIQTNSHVTAEKFRKLIYEHYVKPVNGLLFSDITPPGEWENPLEKPDIQDHRFWDAFHNMSNHALIALDNSNVIRNQSVRILLREYISSRHQQARDSNTATLPLKKWRELLG